MVVVIVLVGAEDGAGERWCSWFRGVGGKVTCGGVVVGVAVLTDLRRCCRWGRGEGIISCGGGSCKYGDRSSVVKSLRMSTRFSMGKAGIAADSKYLV